MGSELARVFITFLLELLYDIHHYLLFPLYFCYLHLVTRNSFLRSGHTTPVALHTLASSTSASRFPSGIVSPFASYCAIVRGLPNIRGHKLLCSVAWAWDFIRGIYSRIRQCEEPPLNEWELSGEVPEVIDGGRREETWCRVCKWKCADVLMRVSLFWPYIEYSPAECVVKIN